MKEESSVLRRASNKGYIMKRTVKKAVISGSLTFYRKIKWQTTAEDRKNLGLSFQLATTGNKGVRKDNMIYTFICLRLEIVLKINQQIMNRFILITKSCLSVTFYTEVIT